MMYSLKIEEFLFERPITINSDKNIHKKEVRRGFIAATIYSIGYGFFEYFIVRGLFQFYGGGLGTIINWVIMFSGMLFVEALATGFSVEKSFMAWLNLAVVEDLSYWIAQWINTGVYPFPAPNWWDNSLATLRLLGGLGQAIPFWPYVPQYYLPGFILLIIYYISSYQNPKYGRITAWMVGPFTIAIIGGSLFSDIVAAIILISLPTISYLFVLSLLYRNDWRFKEK